MNHPAARFLLWLGRGRDGHACMRVRMRVRVRIMGQRAWPLHLLLELF